MLLREEDRLNMGEVIELSVCHLNIAQEGAVKMNYLKVFYLKKRKERKERKGKKYFPHNLGL